MKKILFLLIILIILYCCCSCEKNVQHTVKSYESNLPEKYYKIETDKMGDYMLDLLDKKGSIIYHQKFSKKAPDISKINNEIIEIRLGVGSSAIFFWFYDLKNKKISEEYFNAVLIENSMIAYMNINYKLVIRDIFDKRKYYKEITRNFTECAVPSNAILSMKFIRKNVICIEYLEGEKYTERKETIDISKLL